MKFEPKQESLTLPSKLSVEDQAYLAQLGKNVEAAQIALNTFGNYLGSRYKLDPEDQLQMDGTIIRKSKCSPLT